MNVLYVEDNTLDADLTMQAIARSAPHITLEWARTFADASARLARCTQAQPGYDLLLTDMRLPDGSGIMLLPVIQERRLPVAVVVLTGQGSEEAAVAALKAGASDYLVKRGDYLARLPRVLETALQRYRAEAARRARSLRVLYAEHHSQDVDLTVRHFAMYAPQVRLEIVDSADGVLRRMPRSAHSELQVADICDLLLLDYRLPGMNGLELLKELLQERGLDLPVVFVTGQGDEELALQVLRLGAADYIVKSRGYLFQLPWVLESAFNRVQLLREQTALRKSEENFRAIFEGAAIGIALVDAEGRPVKSNPALQAMLGYSEEELAAMPFAQYTHPDDIQTNLDLFAGVMRGQSSGYQLEKRYIRKNGETLWGRLTNSVVRDAQGGPRFVIGMVEDIGERKRAEEQVQRQIETLSALNTGAQALAASLDSQRLAADAARMCVEVFGARMAWVGRAEFDGRVLPVAEFPLELHYAQTIVVRWDDTPAGNGPAGRAMRSGVPAIVPDVHAEPRYEPLHQAALAFDFKSAATFPLISRSRPVGALLLYGRQTDYFSPERVGFFQTYAHQLATALENARLFEETERRLQQVQALRTIDMAITSSLDLHLTLNIILEQVVTQLHVDAADILLLKPNSQTLSYAAGRGFRTTHIQQTQLRIGEGRAGRAVLERQTISGNADGAQPDRRYTSLAMAEGIAAHLATPLIAKGQVNGVLEVFGRSALEPDDEWRELLEILAGQTAIAVDNATLFDSLQVSNIELTMAYDATIEGWSHALDLRDRETEGHTQRVTDITLSLAQTMGLNEDEIVHVRRGALLHDIGKMGVPDSILLKPGPLTDEEWVIMRKHPTYAYELLYPIKYLRPALDIPYCHHEKWDGTGYPRGLKGEQIPLSARVFAVIDVWDALCSDRPYRKAWPEEQVREHLRSLAGTHFDPYAVDAFLRLSL